MRATCHCEGIELEVPAVGPVGYACYCDICRKIAGSAFSAVVCAPPGTLRVVRGGELLAKYNASEPFDRYHCARCHAPVYAEGPTLPDVPVFIPATAFAASDVAHVAFDHMFVRSLVPWHRIADDGRPRHETFPPSFEV
jgi:hypothetical protein